MSRRHRRSRLPVDPVEAHIESLTHDGKGVARLDGKATFIRGALPGELVTFRYTFKRRSHDEGQCVQVLTPSTDRVAPRCAHADICGGCVLQHLDADKQIAVKADVLRDGLQRIGQVQPQTSPPPLTGPHWAYRHKARLGVKYLEKTDRMLVGFREAGSAKVAEIDRCEILHPSIGQRIGAIRALLRTLQGRARIPQLEVAVADRHAALIVRHLDPLSDPDQAALRRFRETSGIDIYLQSGGPETVAPLDGQARELIYTLEDDDLRMAFRPQDFTQINPHINRKMLASAMDGLALNGDDRVLDLFCGLGNFTLPIARRAGCVVGVEGDDGLVAQARDNAARNHIGNAEFFTADLFEDQTDAPWMTRAFTKVVLDPPRCGAAQLIPQIARLQPQRIVYVSCHPGALARDAGLLVNQYGYTLRSAGVMDMFPHTAHVESIAVFDAKGSV